MIFAIVLGAVLLVFGAIALRLDLKDRRYIRGSGRRVSLSQRAVRSRRRDIEAGALREGPNPIQSQLPPSIGGY
jgi:hypothetical protein